MRTSVTLGVLSLVGGLAFVGCGDDEGDGNTGGSGGSAGSSNNAGSGGGSLGGTGGGGNGGTSGSGGGGGTGGAAPTANCTGCAVLSVPFSAAAQTAGYQLSLTAPGLDLSTAVITFNVQVYTPNPNLTLQATVQNAGGTFPGFYGAPQVAITAANFPAGTFASTISIDMATVAGPSYLGGDAGVADAGDAGPTPDPAVFDKTSADLLNLQFASSATFTGTFNALIAIDSIAVTNVPGYTGVTFTTGLDGLRLNTYTGSTEPAGTPPPVAQ